MKLKRIAACFLICFVLAQCFFTTTTAQAATKKNYTREDLKLMSCIIWCEAGNQSFAGKLAVGSVVMNRVKSNFSKHCSRCDLSERSVWTCKKWCNAQGACCLQAGQVRTWCTRSMCESCKESIRRSETSSI